MTKLHTSAHQEFYANRSSEAVDLSGLRDAFAHYKEAEATRREQEAAAKRAESHWHRLVGRRDAYEKLSAIRTASEAEAFDQFVQLVRGTTDQAGDAIQARRAFLSTYAEAARWPQAWEEGFIEATLEIHDKVALPGRPQQ